MSRAISGLDTTAPNRGQSDGRRRTLVLLSIHILIVCISYLVAFLLRFEFSLSDQMTSLCIRTLPIIVGIKLAVFYLFGSFQSRWRSVTFPDLALLLEAATVSTICIFIADALWFANSAIPRSVLFLDWGATVIGLGGVRSSLRVVREYIRPAVASHSKRRALVVGVDEGGEAIARQLRAQPEAHYRIVGFLDKDPSRIGSRVCGIPLLGSTDDAVLLAKQKNVSDIFVITGSICGEYLRALVDECRESGIRIKMIPQIGKILDGTYELQIRDVDINDLLHRDPVKLDTAAIAKMLNGRTVMVTGAGGSIGSEICRQIAVHSPSKLVLLERAENSLFHIEQEMKQLFTDDVIEPCVADVCDRERLHAVFQAHRPDVVFHAAAHKHVPLMEINAGEAVKNNVFGTKNVTDMAHEYDVDRFILISTDKVVHPTSVMGVSKKLCECYVYAMAAISTTKFVVVRFGNVLGSNGSVVPTFQEQIRAGGPVTVTHAEMRRFFMTIPEASQLVLQAAVLGKGGESFVLEMGDPVKIVDLARDLIRLSGFSEGEIETKFVGIRPGEKLYEEIYETDERSCATSHSKLRVVYPQAVDKEILLECMNELEPYLNASADEVREKLFELVKSKRHLVPVKSAPVRAPVFAGVRDFREYGTQLTHRVRPR